jgi:hypothetical protein
MVDWMQTQLDSFPTRLAARFLRAAVWSGRVSACVFGIATAGILCAAVLSTTPAIAQDDTQRPEMNAPVPEAQPAPVQDAPAAQDQTPFPSPPSSAPSHNPAARPTNHHRGVPPNLVQPQPAPVAEVVAQPTPVLLQPAKKAEVSVTQAGISVQADNSNLSQVLHDISSATGMKVEGLAHDERIFGNYGPAAPRDLLTTLLYGAGYNVLMVGEIADGAPRQLILSQRTGGTAAPAAAPAQGNAEEDEPEPDPGEGQEIEQAPVQAQPPPPPMQRFNSTPGSEVRTPQQLLEQLQRMHQDQSQQPQQPPQQ